MTRLTRLRLTDYRNYASLDLSLDGRHVCLFGANGAGKTNLLEAISQFSPGRGLRAVAIAELARAASPGSWALSADLVERPGEDPRRIGVALEKTDSGARRILRLDGTNATASDLSELVRIVWLTPAMDRVFAGGASERRRFFDRQVMAHIPSHGPVSGAYERAMRERNALLERPSFDPAWADAIEGRMAEAAAAIHANRTLILQRMQDALDTRPDGAFPKADLALDCDTEADIPALLERWRSERRRDAAAGRTLFGPHRADLTVVHRPTGLPADQCSTGQQKALLIALVLASARALGEVEGGPKPLLLLDEAAAHLDADRRAALFDELHALGGQSWLTGTDESLFDAFGERALRLAVNAGTVQSSG